MRVSCYEDYMEIAYMGNPDASSAAQSVAYTYTRPGERDYVSGVRVKSWQDGSEHKISAGGTDERNPRFSPDGKRVAFLSDADGGVSQIWVADVSGKNVMRLTSMRAGVKDFIWSPTGKELALISECGAGEAGAELERIETAAEKSARLEKASMQSIVIEDYGYKSDGDGSFTNRKYAHIWSISASGGALKRLTDGDFDHVMPLYSPDGTTLYFTSNRNRPRSEIIGMDVFSISRGGGDISQVTKEQWIAYYPMAFQPMITPDGRALVYGAMSMTEDSGIATRLFKQDLASGEVKSLWPDNAPCHEATSFVYNCENYMGFGDTALLDDGWVYFTSGWQGATNVYRAALEGEARIERVTNFKATVRAIRRAGAGKLVIAMGNCTSFCQLYTLDVATDKLGQITDTAPALKDRALSQVEEIWFDTLDGKGRVHGFVLPPQDRAQNRKYPAILYIHGGPTPFYGYALTYEYQLLAAQGFAVIYCNPRGSSGYGSEHARGEYAMDGSAMTDLLQFVNEVCRRYDWIDSGRVGVTGGSYGGYMTNVLITRTKRFKAAVSQRGICNELISYASSDMAGSARGYENFRDFMKAMMEKSPVVRADEVEIPLLILHGMNDMRCPVEQAHQFYTAVKDCHPELPVRMVLFPDCNHTLPMEGPMDMRIMHWRETADWFRKYL